MTFAALLRLAVLSAIAIPSVSAAAAGITAPDANIGRNLQVPITVRLPDTKPRQNIKLTVTSDQPARLLLSTDPEKTGVKTISLNVPPQFLETPTFWLQGLADSGTATYTVSAEGLGRTKGKVKLTSSSVVIVGPYRAPRFPIGPRSQPARITVVSAALNREGKVGAEEQLAGGLQIEIPLSNSNPSIGRLRASKLTLRGGSSSETTLFEPAAEGETTLAPVQPRGFRPAKDYAAVTAAVAKPGMAIDGEIFLGKDLQVAATLCLGEAAPPGGVEVTLASSDPSKLILALRQGDPGSPSIRISVPEGQFIAPYFIYSLADSGIVTYEAAAPGYRSRVARVGLARSGVIIAYDPYGPPDEASVLRKGALADERSFSVSLGNPKQQDIKLVVWTAYIDRETGRAADITVQPLRPGVKATVNVTSSNPEVGTVESPLSIQPGTNHVVSRFKPLNKGTTVISVDTPEGFTTPHNATAVPATVTQ